MNWLKNFGKSATAIIVVALIWLRAKRLEKKVESLTKKSERLQTEADEQKRIIYELEEKKKRLNKFVRPEPSGRVRDEYIRPDESDV